MRESQRPVSFLRDHHDCKQNYLNKAGFDFLFRYTHVMVFYQGSNGRTAVLLPGRGYSPNHPVLYYAREVLLVQGWSVKEVNWSPEDLVSEEAVIERSKAELNEVADRNPLVLGKSLGSFVLPWVVQQGWQVIWLTPLLNRPELITALKSVTGKTLLVGGTADVSWESNVAKASGQQVLEMPGADHGLEVPGNPLASVALLRELVETVTLFVESL